MVNETQAVTKAYPPTKHDAGLVLYIVRKGLDVFHGALSSRIDEMNREAGGPQAPGTNHRPEHVQSHLDIAASLLRIVTSLIDAIQTISNAIGLAGNDQRADTAFRNLISFRERYRAEVVDVLTAAAAHGASETTAVSEEKEVIARVEGSVRAIHHQIQLELKDLDAQLQVTAGPGRLVPKTVVAIDRYRYSKHAHLLESYNDAHWVEFLNREIAGLVDECLEACGAQKESTFVLLLGDGALVLFDSPEQAWLFVRKVHENADGRNTADRDPATHLHFRSGVATGQIVVQTSMIDGRAVGFSMAGTTIIRAVRLQTGAKTGQTIVCMDTHNQLPQQERKKRGWRRVTVKGKPHDPACQGWAMQLVAPAREPRERAKNRRASRSKASRHPKRLGRPKRTPPRRKRLR